MSPLPRPARRCRTMFRPHPSIRWRPEGMTAAQSRIHLASQKQLMWWKFKQHRLALASGIFLLAVYLMIVVVEFIAPYGLHTQECRFHPLAAAARPFLQQRQVCRPLRPRPTHVA